MIAMLTSTQADTHLEGKTSQELLKEVDALQAKLDHARMATLGELLSTTTHEFNNILMSVINYTQLAMRQKDDEARQRAAKSAGCK